MKPDEGTTSSPKAGPPKSPTACSRPSLLRSVFSISSFQHHLSLSSSTEVFPSLSLRQLKATSAPSTPSILTAPPSQDITAADKMPVSEAGTDYFMPDVASPMSTPGRGLVPFTAAPALKTLGIDWRYGAQGKQYRPMPPPIPIRIPRYPVIKAPWLN